MPLVVPLYNGKKGTIAIGNDSRYRIFYLGPYHRLNGGALERIDLYAYLGLPDPWRDRPQHYVVSFTELEGSDSAEVRDNSIGSVDLQRNGHREAFIRGAECGLWKQEGVEPIFKMEEGKWVRI